MAAFDVLAGFHAAYADPALVVLEGFHALKHAWRFKAELLLAVTSGRPVPLALAEKLAPDLLPVLQDFVQEVDPGLFARLAPRPPESGVLAIAARPACALDEVLARPGPIVLLDRPTHPGNVGASIRVAAAAGAAALMTLGPLDPWSAGALRGSAGLHFALPVLRLSDLPETTRPLVALDADGELLQPCLLAGDPILMFGSERDGLAGHLLSRADRRLAIPMRDGVSSLNLATSVAVTLYARRG